MRLKAKEMKSPTTHNFSVDTSGGKVQLFRILQT